MKAFFEGIENLFVNHLFWPYDFLRYMHSWWTSNMVNWLFFILGVIAMGYWLNQLKVFNDRGEEDKTISAHSFM